MGEECCSTLNTPVSVSVWPSTGHKFIYVALEVYFFPIGAQRKFSFPFSFHIFMKHFTTEILICCLCFTKCHPEATKHDCYETGLANVSKSLGVCSA